MNLKKQFLILLGLVVLVIWWIYPDKPGLVSELKREPVTQPAESVTVGPMALDGKTPKIKDKIQKEPFSIEDATGQRFQQIANSYEDISQYPPYSIPLTDQDWDLLNPLAFTPVKQVLDPAKGLSASLSVPSYVLYKGEDIGFVLQVEADQPLRQAESLSLQIKSQGNELQSISLKRDESLAGHFSGRYEYQQNAKDWPEELQAVVKLDKLLDESQVIATGFKYVSSAGELLGVEQAYVEGAHLMIPLVLKLNNGGYYRLRMNLKGIKPVSHINSRQKLDKGRQRVLLKVHISTLKAANDGGPYVLQDFNITRLSERPGQLTAYVKAQVDSLAVAGFPLSEYDDEPYQDPMQQQRQEFFQRLSP